MKLVSIIFSCQAMYRCHAIPKPTPPRNIPNAIDATRFAGLTWICIGLFVLINFLLLVLLLGRTSAYSLPW